MNNSKIILEMKNISKSFPGVKALKNVDFELKEGEVHALVGENGAGKSTLMKIISGFHKKDFGKIYINGNQFEIMNPRSAIEIGISTVYQDIIAVPGITVAENILLGNRPRNKLGLVNWKKMSSLVNDILKELSINLPTDEIVSNLSTAQQQLVEIVKALSIDAKIVIMDEPTAPLTGEETRTLFNIIKKIKSRGVSIIYISHRMEEIFEIADRITVLRDGKKIVTKRVKETNSEDIVKYMIGRELEEMFEGEKVKAKEKKILSAKNFNKKGDFKNIDFDLFEGEILGFAGLVGAGRSELMKSIFGIDEKDSGEISISGRKVNLRSPIDAIRNGIGFVPEDRKTAALILDLPVDQNISLSSLKSISRHNVIVKKKEKALAKRYVDKLSIVCAGLSQKVENLSGGNQQKVVISRWLARNPKILILDEPTKGIDVGSKAEIHKLIVDIAQKGTSVIIVSSEMVEILKMSHRIIIMREGRLVNEIDAKEANEEIILKDMTGI